MVCNRYSPDEVELYLVDFKKGVEFKDYADVFLPHAKVIVVESEREFGISVLRAIDKEMTVRSELFKHARVENIGDFRRTKPDARMPRGVLIVDEFQEFFTREDKIKTEALLLFDRIVRQGRSFGIHVMLGTQSFKLRIAALDHRPDPDPHSSPVQRGGLATGSLPTITLPREV